MDPVGSPVIGGAGAADIGAVEIEIGRFGVQIDERLAFIPSADAALKVNVQIGRSVHAELVEAIDLPNSNGKKGMRA